MLLWALLTGTGAIILALPDAAPAIITLSPEHGPSFVDGLGIVGLLAGFGVLLGVILRRRASLTRSLKARPWLVAGLAFLAGIGSGLVLAGVFTAFRAWWMVGMLFLQGFWLALAVLAHA